jgi:hypothetical protein
MKQVYGGHYLANNCGRGPINASNDEGRYCDDEICTYKMSNGKCGSLHELPDDRQTVCSLSEYPAGQNPPVPRNNVDGCSNTNA